MRKITLLLILLCVSFTYSQSSWKKINPENLASKSELYQRKNNPETYDLYKLDINQFKNELLQSSKGIKNTIFLPENDGKVTEFTLEEASNFTKPLNPIYGLIRSYNIKSIDNNTHGKISFGNDGVHLTIYSPDHTTLYLDPYTKDNGIYISYNRKDISNTNTDFECLFDDSHAEKQVNQITEKRTANDGVLRTYRLALACTGEYAQFHVSNQGVSGGTEVQQTAAVLSAMNTTMARVNGIYQKDLSVTMNIILDSSGNNPLIFLDAATDNLSNSSANTLINESQTICDNIIGNANYDIGHTFSTGGGGLAGLGVVCIDGSKGRGITGTNSPIGDPYDVDFVAHELGHQFGGPHTFNNSCSGNRSGSNAVEPGSGSTIMAYAGICAPNVQSNSNDYFHAFSLTSMWNTIQNNTSCATETNTGNAAPIANAGSDVSVPKGTPLILKGSATDADGTNSLTYCWEQIDIEIAAMPPVSTSTGGPAFRSLSPTTSPNRYLPALSTVTSGSLATTWEVLPSVAREMNFALVVRDNNPGGASSSRDDLKITIVESQPFTVNDQFNWGPNTSRDVTWNVNGTSAAPINCQKVNILLSTDGGVTFPTQLAMNTDNDGSEMVTLPNLAFTDDAILMIEAADNIFYNISKKFSINNTPDFTLVNKTGDLGICKSSASALDFELQFNTGNGFSDDVTLSVNNAPTNAIVSFNKNNFTGNQTVLLTISNIDNIPAGPYTFSVMAASASVNKSIDINLSLSNDVCGSIGSTTSQISTREVQFNTIDNASTKTNGYSDFKSISTTVKPGEDHQISIDVNTTSTPFTPVSTRTFVWIDWNQNCQFDANEEYDLGSASSTGIVTTSASPYNLTVPNDAKPGNTTFRVTTKIISGGDPTSCEDGFNGEVEDYTIFVDAPTATVNDFSFNKFNLFPNPSSGKFNLSFEVLNTDKVNVKLFDLGGRLIENLEFKNTSSIFSKKLSFGDYNAGIYLLKVNNGGKQTIKKLIIK